jgi:hypothetical protein
MGRTRKRTVGPRRRKSARKPSMLMAKDLDEIAQRRCLMILSVLSGEKSVEEAASEVQMAPAAYYQLETKALKAMLVALTPGVGSGAEPTTLMKQLEEKVTTLERDKRRMERLLMLTRQVVKPGPMSTGQKGRVRLRSTESGSTPSRSSKRSTKKKTQPQAQESSTPTPAGAGGPSDGTGSWPQATR